MKWLLFLIAATAVVGCSQTPTAENTPKEPTPENVPAEPAGPTVRGKIVVELYPDKAPKTVAQILDLVDNGFYNGQRFHRVEDWVIQWGDPQSKLADWRQRPLGTQGAGKPLPYEDNDLKMAPGTLAMASTGERVGGDSQMFILTNRCQPAQLSFLQGKYCAFGKVTEGMDIVDSLAINDSLTMKRIGEKPKNAKDPVRVEIEVSTEG